MDAYAKTILTVIAACLALQVAQGFGLAAAPGPEEVKSRSAATGDRFQVFPIPMARRLFRLDRATGETWSMPIQAEKKPSWTPVDEAPPKAMAPKKSEKAPSQPEKKADGAEE